MEMKQESNPLRWPEGWPRTRLGGQKKQASWKKSFWQVSESLAKEMKRLGATSYLITRSLDVREVGIAVYFSLKPISNEDWQEALGLVGIVPTFEQIDRAYRERAKRVHPDGPTPDVELFNTLAQHRERAKAWATGKQTVEHEKVIACDLFDEQRLNLNAIRLTIAAMRQIARCGASVMMERAWRGFSKQITAHASEESHEPVVA